MINPYQNLFILCLICGFHSAIYLFLHHKENLLQNKNIFFASFCEISIISPVFLLSKDYLQKKEFYSDLFLKLSEIFSNSNLKEYNIQYILLSGIFFLVFYLFQFLNEKNQTGIRSDKDII